MNPNQNTRSATRLAAVQALYEMDLTGVCADSVLDEFLRNRWKPKDGDPEAAPGAEDLSTLAATDSEQLSQLVRGVIERRDDLDAMIAPALSSDWTVERLEVLLRAILRAGAYELLCLPDIPVRVVISEYVNVAKAFYDKAQPGLVNGVLDTLAQTLRGAEMGKTNGG
ncbi:MAG: transcription antitermination factor NusB [Alphaproteobacteria bacterium]